MSKKNHSKLKNLLDYLISMRNSCDSWIFRKEIAAWTAIVLYLTALFSLFNIVKNVNDYRSLFIIGLFLFFVFGLVL